MTALVTGAAGFVGRHMVNHLAAQGYSVHGMGRGQINVNEQQAKAIWYGGEISLDLLASTKLRPDIIVHCAGGASVAKSLATPHQDFRDTVDSTAAVLEYIRTATPRSRLVYISSAAVYGKVIDLPIGESTELNPVSPYGVHKRMAEMLCELYAHEMGLNVAIVRLFSVYGAGLRKQLLWDACNKLTQGDAVFFGTGDEIRDWLHVQDAVRLINRVIDIASPECPILNGGRGEGVTVKGVLETLCRFLGLDALPMFTGHHRGGDPDVYVADVARARSLGWSPEIEMEKGLESYVRWYESLS